MTGSNLVLGREPVIKSRPARPFKRVPYSGWRLLAPEPSTRSGSDEWRLRYRHHPGRSMPLRPFAVRLRSPSPDNLYHLAGSAGSTLIARDFVSPRALSSWIGP